MNGFMARDCHRQNEMKAKCLMHTVFFTLNANNPVGEKKNQKHDYARQSVAVGKMK